MDAPTTADVLHMCRSIHIFGKGDVTLHVTLLWFGVCEDCNEHKLRSSLSAVELRAQNPEHFLACSVEIDTSDTRQSHRMSADHASDTV